MIKTRELLNVQKQATNTNTETQRIKNIVCNQKRKQHQFANRERLSLYALKQKNKAQRANSQTEGRGRPWQCKFGLERKLQWFAHQERNLLIGRREAFRKRRDIC